MHATHVGSIDNRTPFSRADSELRSSQYGEVRGYRVLRGSHLVRNCTRGKAARFVTDEHLEYRQTRLLAERV
jgi:hypothetical protein